MSLCWTIFLMSWFCLGCEACLCVRTQVFTCDIGISIIWKWLLTFNLVSCWRGIFIHVRRSCFCFVPFLGGVFRMEGVMNKPCSKVCVQGNLGVLMYEIDTYMGQKYYFLSYVVKYTEIIFFKQKSALCWMRSRNYELYNWL